MVGLRRCSDFQDSIRKSAKPKLQRIKVSSYCGERQSITKIAVDGRSIRPGLCGAMYLGWMQVIKCHIRTASINGTRNIKYICNAL